MPITNLYGSTAVNISTATTTEVVVGAASKRIRIFGICLQAAGAVNITLKSIISGSSTVNLSGPMPQAANTGFAKTAPGQRPIFTLPKGASFSITTDQAVVVAGWVEWEQDKI